MSGPTWGKQCNEAEQNRTGQDRTGQDRTDSAGLLSDKHLVGCWYQALTGKEYS